jgi:hypothetical protein
LTDKEIFSGYSDQEEKGRCWTDIFPSNEISWVIWKGKIRLIRSPMRWVSQCLTVWVGWGWTVILFETRPEIEWGEYEPRSASTFTNRQTNKNGEISSIKSIIPFHSN